MDHKMEFGGQELLDSVEMLWKELNLLHEARSQFFREDFSSSSFAARKQELCGKAERGVLRVAIASDQESRILGYCISSIEGGEGEIDSIYVIETSRRSGMGAELIEDSMDWFQRNSAERLKVSVVYGNEEAFKFYRKFGLFPRVTILSSRKCPGGSED